MPPPLCRAENRTGPSCGGPSVTSPTGRNCPTGALTWKLSRSPVPKRTSGPVVGRADPEQQRREPDQVEPQRRVQRGHRISRQHGVMQRRAVPRGRQQEVLVSSRPVGVRDLDAQPARGRPRSVGADLHDGVVGAPPPQQRRRTRHIGALIDGQRRGERLAGGEQVTGLGDQGPGGRLHRPQPAAQSDSLCDAHAVVHTRGRRRPSPGRRVTGRTASPRRPPGRPGRARAPPRSATRRCPRSGG